MSSSGEYKAIISDNKNYLLTITDQGLFSLNIAKDEKTMLYTRPSDVPLPLFVKVENFRNYGEVKVFSQEMNSTKNSCWWSGTSETTDNGPYKLKVTNQGKMLVVNGKNLGIIYKKVGASAGLVGDQYIRIRLTKIGSIFMGLVGDERDKGKKVIGIEPEGQQNSTYFIYFPSTKCLALQSNYNLVVTRRDGGCKEILSWNQGCSEQNRANISWDEDGYILVNDCNKYLFLNEGSTDDVFIQHATGHPKSKCNIIYWNNTYTTIPTDSDCVMSPWSECDILCKDGIQTRTKISSQSGQGTACDNENLTRTGFCGSTPCPVDCVLTDWSDWGRCSKDCDGGTKKRTRTKTKEGKYGGELCPPDSALKEEEECNTEACPPPGSVPPPPPPTPGGNTNSQPPTGNDNTNSQPPPGGNTNSQPPPGNDNTNSQPPPGGNTNSQPPPSAPRNDNTNSQPPPSQVIKAVESEDFISKYKWWIVGGITFFFLMIIIIVIVLKKKKTE